MQSITATRWHLVSIGILVCIVTLGSTTGIVAADPAGVAITGTAVSDAELETGDTITITPTVQYASSESGSFEVREVTVTDTAGTRFARVGNIGVLGSGETLDVPLQATFETAGDRHLTVHVRGTQYDDNGSVERLVHREYPVYVSVTEPTTETETKPQVRIEPESAVAGADTEVNVTVSNGADSAISNVSLQLAGSTEQVTTQTQLQPVIHAHNSSTFQFQIQPSTAGPQTLTATLRYGDGDRVVATERVSVAAPQDDASVFATARTHNGSTTLQYHITNRGNRPLTEVVVGGSTAGSTLPTVSVKRIPPATTETVTASVNGQPTGTATITASYTVGSQSGQTEQTVTFETTPNQTVAQQTQEQNSSSLFSDGAILAPGLFLIGGIVTVGVAIGYRNWQTRDL